MQHKCEVGDVVETGGMRGIITAINYLLDEVLVAAGRTDDGVWVKMSDITVVYRESRYHVASCDNEDCDVVMFRWLIYNKCPACGRFSHVKGDPSE